MFTLKLNIKQIQALDFLLQRLNSIFLYTSEKESLNLVIKFNNSLWKGNFIYYKNSSILNYYIDFDSCIESKTLKINDLFKLPHDFNNYRYRYSNITFDKIYLLLTELASTIKNIDTSNINLEPFLYNATNLETNISLPFLSLNSDDEFEVVSIVKSLKDEYTHS